MNPAIIEDTEDQQERINKLKRAFAYNLFYRQGVSTRTARLNDYFLAVSYTLRDRMQHLFVNSLATLQVPAIGYRLWHSL